MLSNTQIQRLLDIANSACQKGMVAQARTIYEGVLADRPGFAPALIAQAYSHVVVDDFDGAEVQLRAFLKEHPDDSDALGVLGIALFLADRAVEAREIWSRVPEGSPAADMARAIQEA